MKPAILALGMALALVVSAAADMTLKQTINGTGMFAALQGTGTTYIKGMKMRSEAETRGGVLTSIHDLENQKMYVLDSHAKKGDVWDMQAFSAELAKSVATGQVKSTLKPNGETKAIAGKTASGYDVDVTVPATVGGPGGMEMTVSLHGKAWIVKDAPGTADYAAFYKAAAERGWIFSDPRGAKGSPGQAKAMAEMYRQLAATGGVPYETDTTISISGEGPMAAVMSRMGNMTMTGTVQSIDTAAVDEALFAPPAGYKLTTKD